MQNNVAKFTLPRVEPRLTAKVATVESKGLADPWPDLYAMFGVSATASGLTISADRALQFPAVSSAIRLLSEAVASLKLTAKKRGADGREVDVPGHAVLGLLTGAANDWTSSYEFIRDLMIDALSDDRGGLGHVNRVNGTAIELIRYRSGVLNVQYNQDTGEPTYAFSTRKVPLQDVIHVRAPFGRSPLSLAREAIATGIVLSDHAAKLFGNGARPSGVLSFPKGMGEGSVDKARAAWRATHEGQDAGGKTAVLHDGATFTPLAFNSTDSEFIANRKFQILEIARAFRVPPSMVYDLDRATWSNTEQMGREFLIYSLEPWLKTVEGALTRALAEVNILIRFDRDDLTRADIQTRAVAINSLIASRVLNPNEGRDWLDLPPREGGEEYLNPNITAAPAPAAPGDANPTDPVKKEAANATE